MGKSELKKYLFTIINLFIFVTTAIAVPITLLVGSRSTRLDGGDIPYWQHIATFTILSNIFLGFVALILAILNVTKKERKRIVIKSDQYHEVKVRKNKN